MEREKRYQVTIRIMAAVLFALSAYFIVNRNVVRTSSDHVVTEEKRPRVVIDAGHGGADPGKVGVNGALEKDINLEIARKLQMFLEMADVEVILTRDSDAGLYDEDASNKKVQDMKRRVEVIEQADPAVTISIHQNSYHEEYVHGAQTFYYTGSEQSKLLAEEIQQLLLKEVDPDNTRVAKSNDSYYLLKKTSSPIVIVECGFLSNGSESQKLASGYYQEKLAWAIHLGVLRYINSLK